MSIVIIMIIRVVAVVGVVIVAFLVSSTDRSILGRLNTCQDGLGFKSGAALTSRLENRSFGLLWLLLFGSVVVRLFLPPFNVVFQLP